MKFSIEGTNLFSATVGNVLPEQASVYLKKASSPQESRLSKGSTWAKDRLSHVLQFAETANGARPLSQTYQLPDALYEPAHKARLQLEGTSADRTHFNAVLHELKDPKVWNHQHIERVANFLERNGTSIKVAYANLPAQESQYANGFIATDWRKRLIDGDAKPLQDKNFSKLLSLVGKPKKDYKTDFLFVLPRPQAGETPKVGAEKLSNLLGVASAAMTDPRFTALWNGRLRHVSLESLGNSNVDLSALARTHAEGFFSGVDRGDAKTPDDLRPLKGITIDQ